MMSNRKFLPVRIWMAQTWTSSSIQDILWSGQSVRDTRIREKKMRGRKMVNIYLGSY